ncbi:hypothetical protein BC828DRAFT_381691 [Blastocladiella britannica]|nr:hypothetical protein BC828DRAFT_381691 [Blastocladiella britannica]
MDNLASLPSGDLYPGEMAFLYCSVTSRTPSSFEQSIGQGVGCICLFLSRDGKILLQSPDSLDRVEWRVELWTHGNVQPEALMHHVRQAHEQAVLDVAMDDAVAHRQFDDVLWKLARSSDDATGPSSNISGNGNSSGLPLGHQHHPCLHTAALPLRLPPWKVKELVDAVQQAIPKGFAPALPTETAMLQQGPVCRRVQQPIWVVSVTPSTPAADGGFYPTFTHYYLKGDKLTRVNVTRHTCLSVHVQQRPVAAVHLVGWNVKAATFQAIQSAVAAFADAVTLQSQTLSRVTLAKQGYTDRRIQSFPILGSQLEITHPSTPSSSGGVDSGGGGPLPQLRLGSVIGDVVFDRPMLTTATGNETGTESTPSLPALSSDQIATMCPADRHIAAYQAFVIAYDQLSKRAEYFVNIYHRWRTLHQRHIRRESESFSPGARDPTSPTALTTRADSAVTDGDLKHVLRFARLIHWCRTPLMFHARVVDQFSLQPAQVAQTPASRDYFATLIPDMFHRYCAYLTTLGLTMISTQAGKDYFSIGPDLTIPADRAFLQKSFQGGILLVEVSVKHIFLAVNLYTVNRRYGPHNGRLPSPGFNAPDYSRQSFRLFAQECSKFKNLVHVNSFVFDYHLHVARSLITASVVTHWGSVIEVLRALMNHFPPAGYSKCRLFHGSVGEPRSALVSYLFSHPVRYRLGLMVQSNAFFLHLQAEPGSSLEYLTVLRQVPVGIEYFVLETPVPTHLHHHRHSSSTSTDGSSSSPSHRRHHHHRRHDDQVYFPHVSRKRTAAASDQQQQQSWSPPEAQRIQDLTQATIQDLVARAETDHTRDKQWQSLLDDDHRGDTRAWLATAREFYCVSIVALDPSVQTLLSMPADWEAIASALEASWSWGVRVLGDAPPPRPAGLRCFLNANNSAMYLLSLHPPHVNVVIRDDREQETGAAVEIFVRSLGRAVWRYLASSVADL